MSIQNLPSWLPTELGPRFQTPPEPGAADRELVRWQELCRELLEERERLREELVRVTEERDKYIQSVYFLTQKDIPFTREEVFATLGQSPSLEDLIKELRTGEKENEPG